MRNFKKITGSVLFFLILILIINAFDFLLVPSGYIRYIIHEVGKGGETDENYDTIILGASHSRNAVNPYLLDGKAGENVFNLSILGATMTDSYYLLKYADSKNDIKRVILDIDYQYWCNFKDREFGDTFIYSNLPVSMTKLEYIKDNLMIKDFRTTFLKRWAYVSSLDDIKNNIKVKTQKTYWEYSIDAVDNSKIGGEYLGKGYFKISNGNENAPVDTGYIKWDSENIHVKTYENLKKIVSYCKKNNIDLICVTSPITPTTAISGSSEAANKYFTKLFNELDVDYYDFNLARTELIPRKDKDFVDIEGHMSYLVADSYSKVLADLINERNSGKLNTKNYFYDNYVELTEVYK